MESKGPGAIHPVFCTMSFLVYHRVLNIDLQTGEDVRLRVSSKSGHIVSFIAIGGA
jgi:hypothetical protein